MGVNLDLVLAIIPKVGSMISIPCSLFIIWESLLDHRNGKGTTIQRALVGMSTVDVMANSGWFLSTWAVPRGDTPLSAGNMATCNYQGFLLQLAIGAPLYNCSLALYYLLVIKYNWTNGQLAKIERHVHFWIILFAVGTSVAGLPLTMYNQVGTVCWVIGSPSECGDSTNTHSDIPCDRGNWAWLFGILLFYGPLWICVILTIVAMAMIYIKIRRTFQQNEQYQFSSPQGHSPHLPTPAVVLDGDNSRALSQRMSRFSVLSLKNSAKRVDFKGELQVVLAQAEEEDGAEEDDDVAENTEPHSEPEPVDPDQVEDDDGKIDRSDDISFEGLNDDSIRNDQEDNTNLQPSDERGRQRILFSSTSCTTISESKSNWRITSRLVQMKNRKTKNQRKQSMFAAQAILYSLSFFITWMPSTIWSISKWFGATGIAWDLAAATCEPLQGFWNMLIFIRSRPRSQDKLKRVFGRFCCMCLNLLPKMPDEEDSSFRNPSNKLDDSSRSRPSIVDNASKAVQIGSLVSMSPDSEAMPMVERYGPVQRITDPDSDAQDPA